MDSLVTFQLGLTQRDQVIFYLLIDSAIQHLQVNISFQVYQVYCPSPSIRPHTQTARPHLDAVHEVRVIVALLVSVSGS